MLKNITRASSLSLLVTFQIAVTSAFSANSSYTQITQDMFEKFGTNFASLEHRNLGDAVVLHLPDANPSSQPIKLTLPNGVSLSYGEIVMYGGDLFGAPGNPISICSDSNKLRCFKWQFEALANKGTVTSTACSNPVNQVKAIQHYMAQLEMELTNSRQNGISDGIFYDNNDVEISKQMNILTCGGSSITGFIPYGTYIQLAQVNFDHFAPDSLIAYKTGHRYALETALQGFKKRSNGLETEANQLLELAYAQNAFANHYLTDSFSAGHMRTPRKAIARQILLPAALNLLIANLMHNEDNRNGLNVVNAEGTSWLAYGDGYLYKPEAQLQREVMQNAMQRSADGVYNTFITGKIPETYPEMRLFPDYSKIEQLNQTSPLFKVEDGVLLKRVDNTNIYDYHWTKYWSGLITLIQFKMPK